MVLKRRRKFGLLLLMLCLLLSVGTVSAKAATASQSLVNGGKWVTVDGVRKYRLSNGKYAKYTWAKIGGKYYFFLKSGKLAQNQMLRLSGKYYYLKKNGQRAESEWIDYGSKTYYFNNSGVRVKNTWVKKNGKYYYFGSDGALVKNQWVSNKKYYVGADGARLTDTVKGGYYLDASGKRGVKVFTGKYIFVGDSRMVGMKAAKSTSETVYIAKTSMGLNWLKNTASVTLDQYLRTNPKVKVVLALGVNDLGRVNGYIEYYKELISKYPDTEFYVLSVNPVNDKIRVKKGYGKLNAKVVAFNKKMYVAFRSRFINTYKDLYDEENQKCLFTSTDGLHYSAKDYKKIYNLIVKNLNNR